MRKQLVPMNKHRRRILIILIILLLLIIWAYWRSTSSQLNKFLLPESSVSGLLLPWRS
ncbi:MAG: hypothetical protein PHR21_08915 [Oscillospiraceae bacterium]|nr:hypothetical protein [Oscillospiraceae bacterium]MDD4368992.1 hypothetical protein [Oscillospiraceae bacterium]